MSGWRMVTRSIIFHSSLLLQEECLYRKVLESVPLHTNPSISAFVLIWHDSHHISYYVQEPAMCWVLAQHIDGSQTQQFI